MAWGWQRRVPQCRLLSDGLCHEAAVLYGVHGQRGHVRLAKAASMRPWSLRTSTCACSLAIMGLQPGRLRLHPGYTWLPPGYVRLQHDHLRLGCSLDDAVAVCA